MIANQLVYNLHQFGGELKPISSLDLGKKTTITTEEGISQDYLYKQYKENENSTPSIIKIIEHLGEEDSGYDCERVVLPEGFDLTVPVLDNPGNIYKLGLQCLQGEHWIINDNEILIGRSGIYEIDDDISINSLKYKYKPVFVKNDQASLTYIEYGKSLMNQARDALYTQTGSPIPSSEQEYTSEEQIILAQSETYLEGYKYYIEGIQGIYDPAYGTIKITENNIEIEQLAYLFENPRDIIIDYIEKEATNNG